MSIGLVSNEKHHGGEKSKISTSDIGCVRLVVRRCLAAKDDERNGRGGIKYGSGARYVCVCVCARATVAGDGAVKPMYTLALRRWTKEEKVANRRLSESDSVHNSLGRPPDCQAKSSNNGNNNNDNN